MVLQAVLSNDVSEQELGTSGASHLVPYRIRPVRDLRCPKLGRQSRRPPRTGGSLAPRHQMR